LTEKGHKEDYDSWTDKVQGDRKTQLVVIGSGIDVKGITKALDDCLVSEEEYEKNIKKSDGMIAKAYEGDKEDDTDPFAPYELEEDKEWEDVEEEDKAQVIQQA